jgi:hypothetical protein|nr:MAG TPA: hypothetical protein [Caudoviricetes sp.]
MIFWIAVILTVAAIVLGCLFDDLFPVWLGIGLTSFVAAVVMLIIIIANNVAPDAQIARCYAQYDSLVYQYENDVYDNDNDLGKRDLMEDIESWNKDLAYYRKVQRNFWVGIFYPNIYDRFDFIELQ